MGRAFAAFYDNHADAEWAAQAGLTTVSPGIGTA